MSQIDILLSVSHSNNLIKRGLEAGKTTRVCFAYIDMSMIRVQSLVSYDSGGEAGQLLLQSEPGVGGRTRSTCYIGSRLTWKSSPEMWPFSWSS